MNRFKNILCVVEPGNAGKAALRRAVALAENNQASLTVLDVIAPWPDQRQPAVELHMALVKSRTQAMDTAIKPYRERLSIQTRILHGLRFLEVVREVLRNGYDLVIKTAETQAWLGRLFGGDDMQLLRKCPCPVWLIKPEAPQACRRILAAVEIDDLYPSDECHAKRDLNRQILELAVSLALSESAELHLAHAWEAVAESTMKGAWVRVAAEQVNQYVEQERERHEAGVEDLLRDVTGRLGQESVEYLNPKIHLVKGWARKEIPALANRLGTDLVVMGTVARTGIPGVIIGNTAETILNLLDCSVLAIKPAGFSTPITLES